ncbi:hypothetical protein [Streptomyces sp. NPDC017202]|uniref:hypothetical protein n=1 Tax=Streptomyces sp. NPDC017202 TaxID=3364981 RepID=UPI00378787D9
MGERMSGGEDVHRRHARPARPVPGDDDGHARVEALLARALRDTSGGAERERQAVAAFRAARDAGAHRARTRRRDDWRPRGQRHTVRSLRATLSVVLASLTLGGVAVAAIGSAGSSADTADGAGRGTSSASASSASTPDGRRAGAAATPSSGAAADRDRPPSAEDTEAHCRAYEQVAGRGRAMDATAWQRLVAAAGGEENVTAYCAARTASPTATPGNGGEGRGAGSADPAGGNTGNTGNTGTTGNAGNTGTTGNAGNAASAGTAGNSGTGTGTGTGTAGNTATSGTAGNTGGSGNTENTGNTGNTGNGRP